MTEKQQFFEQLLRLLDEECLKDLNQKTVKVDFADGSVVILEFVVKEDRKRLELVKSG